MKQDSQILPWLNLPNLPLPLKALFIGYLLVIGVGLCMAGLQIMLTHGMADGKFGLSVNDIVYSYYGDRSGTKLASKLNGSMSDKAPLEVRQDIIKWAQQGAPEDQWESHYKQIFAQHCIVCHSNIPGIPNFTKYEEVKSRAEVNEGATISGLTRVSHIHLFGISFIFFFIGLIFSFAVNVPKTAKIVAIAFPFAFLIVDVMSWWLTKLSPHFAWLTIIGGVGYSLASSYMWVVSMYQMLVLSRNGKVYGNAWAQDLNQ
ncbi:MULTISPECIES: elongation factor-1 alpha [unclassified Methylophilus]|uniref:elongation factor-1 alpha n=1 Tax=unclassified Methylophilus TaxID=2630143 RepID=UPI00039B21EE|nr:MULTISPECIES: elongation factor-1 alpha [unclassified Methylophilus]